MLRKVKKWDQACKDYLLVKAGILSAEGLSAVVAIKPQIDQMGKSSPLKVPRGKTYP